MTTSVAVVADNFYFFSFLQISRVEAAIAMLFDELLTLTAQLHQHRNRTSTGSGELPAIEGKRDDS